MSDTPPPFKVPPDDDPMRQDPMLQAPETDDPWVLIDWLATLEMAQRFLFYDSLLAMVKLRPQGEQEGLLLCMKERLKFNIQVVRQKLQELKVAGSKIKVLTTFQGTDQQGHPYLAEMIYRPDDTPKFGFLVQSYDGAGAATGAPQFAEKLKTPDGTMIHPLETRLFEQRVATLPSGYEEYGTDQELFTALHSLVTKYLVLDPVFAELACAWLLYTWVADLFPTACYLRLFGELGTAKTTFEEIVGRLAYRGILAAGATTASPIFRIVDRLGGTLIVDEADHERQNTEWADIVKLLNTGTRQGHHVLRSERASDGEPFDVHAYSVFGPKMVASREPLRDAAFESRCLSYVMQYVPMKDLTGVPLFLDATFFREAERLRNQLLLWRFRNFTRVSANPLERIDGVEEARVTVAGLIVLAAIVNPEVRRRIETQLVTYSQQLRASRGSDTVPGLVAQSLLLVWVKTKCLDSVPVKVVTEQVQVSLPHVSYQRIGRALKGLGLTTHVRGGDAYLVKLTRSTMARLAETYQVDLESLAQANGAVLPPLRQPVRGERQG